MLCNGQKQLVVDLSDYDLSHIGKGAAVYGRLKHFLTAGHLRAGERLQPSELATLLHVSVTPVREALLRLSLEGFIQAVANRGYFTKPFDLAEQRNLYEMAHTLLQRAIVKSAVPFSPAMVFEPSELHFDKDGHLLGSADRGHVVYAQFIEHLLLRVAGMADNLELMNAVALMLDRTHVLRVVDLEDVGNLRVIATDMREFRDALASGDAARAAANLEQQTSKKFDRLPDLVKRANNRVARASLPR